MSHTLYTEALVSARLMLLPNVTEWRADCLQCTVMMMTVKTLKTKAGCEMDMSNIDLTSRSRDELLFARPGWIYVWILLTCQWLRNFREPEGMVAQWISRLQPLDFAIFHRSGKHHNHADGLSCRTSRPCKREACHECSSLLKMLVSGILQSALNDLKLMNSKKQT